MLHAASGAATAVLASQQAHRLSSLQLLACRDGE
jgi:hypothetical protein